MHNQLQLRAHPEGGFFRRTYTSPATTETTSGTRPAATLIYFFLPAGDNSAWHLVTSDEVWLWHGPGTLQLQLGGTGRSPETGGEVTTLGPPQEGYTAQALVPGGTWQRTLPGNEDVLVSCIVSPGFDFADFVLAQTDPR